MKYAVVLLFLSPFLNSCQSDSQQTAESAQQDSGTPPSAKREMVIPEETSLDTILPDSIPVDTLGASGAPLPNRPNNGSGAPARPQKMYKPSAPSRSSAGTPPGLRGGKSLQGFVDLQQLDPSILIDIRYATTNNFTESKIYDCPRCLLRPEIAEALVRAQSMLQRQGLRLKLYDCYRPRPFQQRLWDKVPNPNYVTPPEKGSMHSRGAAVDLTIVDAQGEELDMGTPYDFFGPEAHYGYSRLSGKVLSNRRLLRRVMEAVGLKGIRTEWWHFSFAEKSYPLSDWVWDCEE